MQCPSCSAYLTYTPPRMFGVGCFWLETRVIIKILTHPLYTKTLTDFHGDEAKKIFFEKKIQNGRLKQTAFFVKISWIGPWVSRID